MELKKQNTKVTKCKKFKHYQIQKEKIKLPQYKCNKIQMQQNIYGTKCKKDTKIQTQQNTKVQNTNNQNTNCQNTNITKHK